MTHTGRKATKKSMNKVNKEETDTLGGDNSGEDTAGGLGLRSPSGPGEMDTVVGAGDAVPGEKKKDSSDDTEDAEDIVAEKLFYSLLKMRATSAATGEHRVIETASGDLGALRDHITTADRLLRKLVRDAGLPGPELAFTTAQVEGAESWKKFDVTRGAAYRGTGYAAERLNQLVAMATPILKTGRGTSLCRMIYEARRVCEYGIAALAFEQGGAFWQNFNISQFLQADPVTGVLGPVDFFDVTKITDYFGRFVSPQFGDTVAFPVVWPNDMPTTRGYAWFLAGLCCQGLGREIVFYHGEALDLRPPLPASVRRITKTVTAWLEEHATAAEKALSNTILYLTQGIVCEINSCHIADTDARAAVRSVYEDAVDCVVFPDRVVLTPDAVAVAEDIADVPVALPATARAVREAEVARNEARREHQDAERAQERAQLAVTQLENRRAAATPAGHGGAAHAGRGGGRAFRGAADPELARLRGRASRAQDRLDEAILALENAEAVVRRAAQAHGNIPADWDPVVPRGDAVGVLPSDHVVDYSLPMASPLGLFGRVSGRVQPLDRDGTQMGFAESDAMFTLAYIYSDMGAVRALLPFWEGCENVRSYMAAGITRTSYELNDQWPEFLSSTFVSEGMILMSSRAHADWASGDLKVGVRRPQVPRDWVPAARDEFWLPPWTQPNVIPVAILAQVVGKECLSITAMTEPSTMLNVGVDRAGGRSTAVVGKLEDAVFGRWVPNLGQEFLAVSLGNGRPLHGNGVAGWALANPGIITTLVVPYASLIDGDAITTTTTWISMSNPVDKAGSCTWQDVDSETIPALPFATSGGRQRRFRS
uniref:Uncharacterized protein n=1 Tax=viral metagenome TaxID=1070528 RepID=A0A2V0RHE3_9ZZZZ